MKILIVDDIKENLYLLETLLKASDYQVVTAKDGAEALGELKKDSIDMIISDILMPKMDGFQLCRECKKDDSLKKIPFVFYTATYTEKKDEEFALSLGAEKFIVKPQEPQAFLNILEEVIEEHKKGVLIAPKEPTKEEELYLAEYNKRLIKKLEKKMLDLEKSKQCIQHLYNVLKAIRGVNQLIIKEKDINVLLQKACDVLIGARGYNTAWLGFLKDERNFAIVVGSPPTTYVSHFCEQVLRGDYPPCIKKAFIQKDSFMIVDRSKECVDCPLKDEHSGKQSAIMRIEHSRKFFGLLEIILAPDVYINEEEKELLEELAGDIAFGLHNIELEKKHQQAERLFKSLFFNSPNAIFIIQDRKFKLINPQFEKETGYSEEEVLGSDTFRFIHPDDREMVRGKTEQILKKESHSPFEFRGIRKDGKIRWGLEVVTSITYQGRTAILGNFKDITEIKRAEKKLLQSYQKLQKTMEGTINTIGKIVETRDPYTAGHQKNVSQLATFIAQEMKLPQDKIEGIRVASLVHDVGKISVPAEILNKPTKLSEIEYSLIKDHAQIGHDILKSIDFSYPIARIVLQHHERIDGSGYPNNLKGNKILLEAKIIGVADVVEAMSSHRPYRPAWGIDKALEEISKNKGILYDPKVADACLKLFKRKEFKF